MERFVAGEIVVLDFPFSDLRRFKRRPALIIKIPGGEDLIICQITATSKEKSFEIPLINKDFDKGGLKKDSFVRIDKITTLKNTRIKYKIGSLKQDKFNEILNELCSFLKK